MWAPRSFAAAPSADQVRLKRHEERRSAEVPSKPMRLLKRTCRRDRRKLHDDRQRRLRRVRRGVCCEYSDVDAFNIA